MHRYYPRVPSLHCTARAKFNDMLDMYLTRAPHKNVAFWHNFVHKQTQKPCKNFWSLSPCAFALRTQPFATPGETLTSNLTIFLIFLSSWLLSGGEYPMYNVQGDFQFFKYKDITVQERVSYSDVWGVNSLLIGAAVKFGSSVFEITNNVVHLNGRTGASVSQLQSAGIQVAGNVFTITYKRITIKIHNHANNDPYAGRNYLALFVEVPEDIRREQRLSGLCVENNIPRYAIHDESKSLFATPAKRKTLPARPPRRFTAEQKRDARRACRQTGLESISSLEDCVYDLLRSNNKDATLRAYKSDHQDNVNLRALEKKTAADNKIALDQCRVSFTNLERQLSNVNRALAEARNDKSNLQNRINVLNNEANKLRSQLNVARSQLAAAEAQVRRYVSENNGLRNSLNNAKIENRNLLNELRHYHRIYAQLQRDCQNRLNQVQQHYQQQIRQLQIQYNNNLQSALRQQSQQFQYQLKNALNRQQQQFQRSFGQMQSYYAQLIAQIQNVLNNHKRNLPKLKF